MMKTPPEQYKDADSPRGLERAIKERGGYAAVARYFGVSRQCVWRWVAYEVPMRRVLELEKELGVPRQELRPDFYPVAE